MHNYLVELFKDENTIILPKLGALTVVDKTTGELMFMSYLKHNDGTLTKFIAQKEQLSESEAKEKVERYVDYLLQMIASGKYFEIDQVGRFWQDAITKEIQFESAPTTKNLENKTVETSKKEQITPPKKESVPPPDEPKEVVSIQQNTSVSTTSLDKRTASIVQEKSTKEEPKKRTETKTLQQKVTATENNNKNTKKVESKVAPAKKVREKNKRTKLDGSDERTKKKRSVWKVVVLPILFMLLIGTGLYVGLYYEELTEKKPLSSKQYAQEKREKTAETVTSNTQTTDDQKERVDEELLIEDVLDETPIIEESPQETKQAITASATGLLIDKQLPIQVIVGSFEDEDNAQKLIYRLQKKGLHAQTIGKYGYLHLVCAASFTSMDEYHSKRSQLSEFGDYWLKTK